MPDPYTDFVTPHTTQLFQYLRSNRDDEFPAAVTTVLRLHNLDPWLSNRQLELLQAEPPLPTLVRPVMRLVVRCFLQSVWEALDRTYGQALQDVSKPQGSLSLELFQFPTAQQLCTTWDNLRDIQEKLAIHDRVAALEKRRLNVQEEYPEVFGRLVDLAGLSPAQARHLEVPITLPSLRGIAPHVFEELLNRVVEEAERLNALEWRKLNEQATDFLEQYPDFVESSPDSRIPVLMEGLYHDSSLAKIQKVADILPEIRVEAERFRSSMTDLEGVSRSLQEWQAGSIGNDHPVAA